MGSSPKESHSTTIREADASSPEAFDDDPLLGDTQLTPIVGEAQAGALARDSSPASSRRAGGALRGSAPPPPVRDGSSSGGGVTRDGSSSRVSVPPSEPRGSRASFSQIDIGADRPARLQLIVALVLGLVLVAIPLYLWRRPRAESITVTSSGDAGSVPVEPTSAAPSADPKPVLGAPKVLLCQDPGPKKTSPEQCDHVVELEKALAKAIDESASCVPKDAGGGSIQYVADVSFKRRSLTVAAPKEGRTLKNAKVATACATAVRSKLGSLAFDSVKHEHARYKVAITATYP